MAPGLLLATYMKRKAHLYRTLADGEVAPVVQGKAGGRSRAYRDYAGVTPSAIAAAGVANASEPLPYGEQIQRAFGRHDIGHVRTAGGAVAAAACDGLGANAYATGDRIAFAVRPDLHTAAHEAAHVVQQRAGVSLSGGVGAAGDVYEQHADRVADLVVSGQSAEAALDEMAAGSGGSAALQRSETDDAPASGGDTAAADEALRVAEMYMDRFNHEIRDMAAPQPWTAAAEAIKAACSDPDQRAETRQQKFDEGIAGLASAVAAASPTQVEYFNTAVAYGRAQLKLESNVQLRQDAGEVDAVCDDIGEMVEKARLIEQLAEAQELLSPGVEAEWKPISLEVPGEGTVEIPTRDEVGAALAVIKAAVSVWKAGDKIAHEDDKTTDLESMNHMFGGIRALVGALCDVSAVTLQQIAANHPNRESAEALVQAAEGLGKVSKILGGMMGGIGGVLSLVSSTQKLMDASLPVIERVDAAVGVISALGSIAEGVVSVAEGVAGEAAAGNAVVAGLSTFGAGCGFLGATWFIVKTWITEFPKIKGFANGLCMQDAEIVRGFAAKTAELADRVVAADELDSAGNDPQMTETKNNAFVELKSHVVNFPNDLRWFSQMRDGVRTAISDSGMASAESPRDAIAAAETLMASLDALFHDIPNMVQRELGLPEHDMPEPPDL